MRFDRRLVPALVLAAVVLPHSGAAPAGAAAEDAPVVSGASSACPRAPGAGAVGEPLELDGGRGSGAGERWLAELGARAPVAPSLRAATAVVPGGLVGGNFAISDWADPVSNLESLDTSSVAYTPARDEYLVVWHGFDRATLTNIYGQRVAANGTLIGGRITICDAPGVQVAPSVSYEPLQGVYWVAWTDVRDGTYDVRVRRVARTGPLLGSELLANDGAADAFAGRVACGTDVCAVVWASDPHDGNTHILIRTWNGTANPLVAIVLLSDVTGYVGEPDVCSNGHDGRFMVVWQKAVSGYWDVWAYHLNWNITHVDRRAISTSVYHQRKPRVSYGASAQRYLVVWEDSRSNVTWDVYGQLLDRAGAFAGGALAVFAGAHDDLAPAVCGRDGATAEFLVAYARDISGATQYQIYASRVTAAGGVSGPYAVRDWYNFRSRPAIAHRAMTDDFLVSFTDDPFVTQADIAARVVRGTGTLAGGQIAVARGRKGQEAPAVAYNALRDEYVAAWADYRFLDDYDIFYRRVSAAGAAVPPEFVLASASALYGDPAIAHNATSDGYLAVWQEVASPSTGYEIYARRLSGALEPLGSPILVSRDTNTPNEGRARVVYNPVSDHYCVVWHAWTGNQWRIWGQRISPAGGLLAGNAMLSVGNGPAQNPRVAHNRVTDEYLVVWQDQRNGRVDVFGQRVAATGAGVGLNFEISSATGEKNRCDVAWSPASNQFLVAWGERRSQNDDVLARRVNADGTLPGAAFEVAAGPEGEISPVVAHDDLGREFLVAYWVLDATTDYDVWARRVPLATPPTVAAFPLSQATEVQTRCELAYNSRTTEFLTVWQDFRNGSYDIYGQRWIRLPRSRVHRWLSGHEVGP